jgi:hypothetical protein
VMVMCMIGRTQLGENRTTAPLVWTYLIHLTESILHITRTDLVYTMMFVDGTSHVND